MDDPSKKVNTEKTDASGDEKTQVPDEKAENVAAGASFGFYDREKRKPK